MSAVCGASNGDSKLIAISSLRYAPRCRLRKPLYEEQKCLGRKSAEARSLLSSPAFLYVAAMSFEQKRPCLASACASVCSETDVAAYLPS